MDSGEGTTLGAQVEFTCNDGFTRLGNQFRECLEDGTWSGTVPTCEGKYFIHCMHAVSMSLHVPWHWHVLSALILSSLIRIPDGVH